MSDGLMIEVEGLTKRYAGRPAVQDVSFRVAKGEVVGLLGPNGAGKSTILRILACYLPASSGLVRVAGFDVFRQAEEVRRRIGYMPEHNPLYRELRVREYLKFRARIKGLSRARTRERIDVVLTQCGLTEVRDQIIGTLSKGYQQRVGLADALLHEPELIILDEPTIGLDPHQIRQVRQLIKDLGRNHTLLISTHILPEVEMTCNRVLILRQGRIQADDTPENLQLMMTEGGQVVAEIAAPLPDLQACWDQMPEVQHAELEPVDGEYIRCTLVGQTGVDLRPLVFQTVRQRGWALRELRRSRVSLEDIFVRMTMANGDEEGA